MRSSQTTSNNKITNGEGTSPPKKVDPQKGQQDNRNVKNPKDSVPLAQGLNPFQLGINNATSGNTGRSVANINNANQNDRSQNLDKLPPIQTGNREGSTLDVQGRDAENPNKRPASQKASKIQMNMGINGIKHSSGLAIDLNLKGTNGQLLQNGAKIAQNGYQNPPAINEEDSPSKVLLNTTSQFLTGPHNVSFENNQLLSPTVGVGPGLTSLGVNERELGSASANRQLKANGLASNQQQLNQRPLNSNLSTNRASLSNNLQGLVRGSVTDSLNDLKENTSVNINNNNQQQYLNLNRIVNNGADGPYNQKISGSHQNRVSPLPLPGNESPIIVQPNQRIDITQKAPSKNVFFAKKQSDMIGIQHQFTDYENNYDDNYDYSNRKRPQSLRSSFDYIDIKMNQGIHEDEATPAQGNKGGSRFFKKNFKEDNWSGDESVFNKQMKMPNVNANKIDYQKEIGLNLDVITEPQRTQKTEERQDTVKEAREMLPDTSFYKIVKKDRIQIIDDYYDRCPLLEFRKMLMRWRVYINRGAQLVVMHSLFETISITVIVVNSLFLAMDDPLRDPSETPAFMNIADDIFQYLYTVEMIFKIVSMGFVVNKGSYLRDAWNILDFVIIASGYMGMFMSGSGANLSVLRSFRVIRPLRTISSVQGLRVIVSSLINAMPLLRDSILVLLFFFMIFAIAGCQLFSGALKNRCFNEETGIIDASIDFCGGGDSCRPGYYCGKSNENPSNGATNFDNVMFSLMQVFQVVTLEGWTAIMVSLMQSVGVWIVIYFYPIVFIGSFFLLNLTLAVIKAKFTEEMNNKKEAAGPPKKKQLDDAPESSEDEDVRARQLQEKIEQIKVSKQMSPRSKENLINKIKIEHLLWRVDNVFDNKEVEHKIVERTEEDERRNNQSSIANKGGMPNKSFYSSAVEKIGILQPQKKTLSYALPKHRSKTKVAPVVNYSDVFYSNKSTVLHALKSPRENLRDIFVGYNGQTNSLQKPKRIGSPIREDDEEQDLTGLLDGELNRAEALRRRDARRGMNGRRPNSGGRGNLTTQQQDNKKEPSGFSKFLGKVFEAKRDGGEGEQKRLLFAGIKNNSVRPSLPGVPIRPQQIRRNPQEYDEHIKRQVYENITRNFDIFEFLDENLHSRDQELSKNIQGAIDGEGDDEMSDELEFQIDDYDNLYFETDQRNSNQRPRQGILDLDDGEEEGQSRESAENVRPLKRGSTQATAAENGMMVQKNTSSEQDIKFTSPFMQSIQRQASLSPRDSINMKKARIANKLQNMPAIQYKDNEKGFLSLFKGCRKMKAKHNGRDYRQEYLLLRKRARSQDAKKGNKSNKDQSTNGQNYSDEFESKRFVNNKFGREYSGDILEEKQMSVRAKSIENKRKQLLAESIRFQQRVQIMRKRRAQFFAPGIKMIGLSREKLQKDFDEYVHRKRKIKVDPEMIDEEFVRKHILYKSASTDALFRFKDIKAFNQAQPLGNHRKIKAAFDPRSNKNRGETIQLDSQRSVFLDKDFEEIVENVNRREEDINRARNHEFVPDFEKVLYDKELKIVVKMKNHQYTSINDVFEKSGPGRYMTDKEKAIIEKEQKKREALQMKLPKRIPARDLIIGYQKKIFIQQKQFHEELLKNEFCLSDEDQVGMMARIEDEYNYDHRSHIFVTGTISVVVNKPHADSQIMNANYHANIKAMNEILKYEHEQKKAAILEQQQLQYQQDGSKSATNKQKLRVTVNGKEESQNRAKSMMNPVLRDPIAKSGVIDGSAWTRIQNMNFSQNASGMSVMRMMKNASRYSMSVKRGRAGSVGESLGRGKLGKGGIPPKPEPLTDKQILKRLNEEVSRSRIFKQLHIKKLPDRIIRRQIVDKQLFKKKKKRNGLMKLEDESIGDDEGSNQEEAEQVVVRRQRKQDYFLDRPVDGNFHITLARDAAFKRHKDMVEWSGQDIMSRYDPYKARLAVKKLNDIRVWPYAVHGFVKRRRVLLKSFMNSPVVEHGMTLCVIGNTVVLSLDYYGAPVAVSDFCSMANTFFTLVFAAEMVLRIAAIGASKWLADKMNYMDGTIVILSLVELIFMSGSGALSALRAVRIFRVFRVLRVARLLRGLKSMVQIINVISRSISSFIYLAMLLVLFIFIYALLGMQVFGGGFTDPDVVGTVRYNFDSFNNAFITSFILLTTENWNQVMFYAFSSSVNQFLIALYFVSCIFIGNWMLLNLFLAILLDAFTAVEEEDMMTPEKKEAIKQKMLEDLKMKEGEDFIEGMDELQKEGFVLKADKKGAKKKRRRKRTEMQKSKAQPVNPAQVNILEESQEVDLQELARRDQELLELRKQLFRGVECEKSCYILSKRNWIRIGCYKMINHSKFETFIMILIVGSSFKLVFDTYTSNLSDNDPLIIYSSKFDLIFQLLFTFEMVIKIIAFGFVMDENSYLTEAWNKLDCFIVLSGLFDTFMEGVNIPFIKVLRLLRILRPLRFVSHSSSMKTLIEALLASMGSILNVGVVIVIVFMMFAILGVNLFAGKLQSCSVDYYKINNQEECFKARGVWSTYDQNMDNVLKAMLTLFVVSNNEGWPDVMYMYCDATGVETGPKPGAGILNAYFFIFFVFVGSFFFINLFVGVLFLNFEKAQRDEKDAMLLDGDEVKWVDMMKMICAEKPEIIQIPKNRISRACYNFVKDDSYFANFIMACIILNIFTMAAIYEGQSLAYTSVMEKINYFFTGAFAFECLLKLIANGGAYFNSGWNKFDFFVVSASFLDIVMANMSANSLKVIRVGPQLARIMRVMRVSRLFKLLNKYKGLQALMQTITFSMPSVINAFALLALVYFIFSVLAVFFFKNIISGGQLDPVYMNFTNFTQALVMMLRLSTGEDWPSVMYDCMNTKEDCIPDYNCGTAWAPLFFLIFVLIQQYIMVNLFILIILQQFDLYYLPDDNVLDRFKADVTNFKHVWRRFSADFEGFKIRGNDVQKFFKELKGDLGMQNEKDQRAIERNLVIMNIQADDDGFIYFNELLYKTMKRRYAPGRTKKKILFEVELKTLEKLENIMKQQIYQSRKKERQKAVAVNPFLSMMYKSMSFNVWKEIYELNLPKRMHHIQLGLEREISDEEEEEEDQEDQSQYVYETEEDAIIDELDKEYLEHLDMLEAERADPYNNGGNFNNIRAIESADATRKSIGTGVTAGFQNPTTNQNIKINHYDQLKQQEEEEDELEDEILSAEGGGDGEAEPKQKKQQ